MQTIENGKKRTRIPPAIAFAPTKNLHDEIHKMMIFKCKINCIFVSLIFTNLRFLPLNFYNNTFGSLTLTHSAKCGPPLSILNTHMDLYATSARGGQKN
jgi:hypothetical protein